MSAMERTSNLEGHFLLAMPTMGDPRFERTVIYLFVHNKEATMGLIINKPLDGINFSQLLEQLSIPAEQPVSGIPVHAGGPVETGRGFVLHSADYVQDSTLVVSETVALTATVDVLRALAEGSGPGHALVALGYAGWDPGQLESEIQQNGWLTMRADDEILFNTDVEQKWPRAMALLGIDISMLSTEAGHA